MFLRYDYAVDIETEQVVAVQWRERLFRYDAKVLWHYNIHEVAHTGPGAQYARKEGVWVRHWRDPNGDTKLKTRERNRRILMKARKEFPDEPRFRYYFANEIYAEAAITLERDGEPNLELINAAIKAYQDFIPEAPSPDDAYIAAHQCGELGRMSGEYLASIEYDLEALAIHPSWPDAYVGIAQSYMSLEDWDKCEFWADACLKLSVKEQTTQVREPLNNEYLPRILSAMAKEAKGDYEAALEQLEFISDYDPSGEIGVKIERLRTASTQEEKQSPLEIERKANFSKRPEKSICFFTLPIPEEWHPGKPNKEGLGGAETCVIEASKRFAADGWRVVVFGTPGEHEGIDTNGVEWWPTNEFLALEKFKVFVSSRSPDVFDSPINAQKKFLWAHDVNYGPHIESGPFGNRLSNFDGVLALSKWHANHLRRLYSLGDMPIEIVPNGIDLDRYSDTSVIKKPNRFIWSSSPDRGIEVVLTMWPQIRREWPDAELRVFYGWAMIDKILEMNPQHALGIYKENIINQIQQLGSQEGGIYWHDRVPQDQLASWQLSSDCWLYCTFFCETFCLTAAEMAAAGVFPITSNVAALKNIVPDQYRVDGWPNNFKFQELFVEKLKDVKANQGEKERQALREYSKQFSWDKSYDIWKKICE